MKQTAKTQKNSSKDAIKKDNEFATLLTPQTDEELRLLEESILANGCKETIKVWNGIIIDGHARYYICTKHDLPCVPEEMTFETKEDAKEWVIKSHLTRRNLSIYDRCVLALKLEEIIREKAKANQRLARGKGVKGNQVLEEDKVTTDKELAKIAGVSHETLRKVRAIENSSIDRLKKMLRAGLTTINAAFNEVESAEKHRKKKASVSTGDGMVDFGTIEFTEDGLVFDFNEKALAFDDELENDEGNVLTVPSKKNSGSTSGKRGAKRCVAVPTAQKLPTVITAKTDVLSMTYMKQPPKSYTFDMSELKEWVEGIAQGKVLNLFAGKVGLNCDEVRVDIDPNMMPDHCMDAFEFVTTWDGEPFDTIILDPPYNLRKAREKYEGRNIGSFTKIKDALPRILKPGGIVITLGYDTVGMSESRGFIKTHICTICHGGDHNDTLVVVERYVGDHAIEITLN